MRTDGRTDRQTHIDMTKLIVAFRNFANAPKKINKGTLQEMNIYLSASASKPFRMCVCVYSGAHAVSTLLKPISHTTAMSDMPNSYRAMHSNTNIVYQQFLHSKVTLHRISPQGINKQKSKQHTFSTRIIYLLFNDVMWNSNVFVTVCTRLSSQDSHCTRQSRDAVLCVRLLRVDNSARLPARIQIRRRDAAENI